MTAKLAHGSLITIDSGESQVDLEVVEVGCPGGFWRCRNRMTGQLVVLDHEVLNRLFEPCEQLHITVR